MKSVLVALSLVVLCRAPVAEAQRHVVKSLKVTVLSTMLADAGTVGEWGFAALVEVDGRKILLDSGGSPDAVIRNADALGIDLSDVQDVVLTHFHGDHTAGLLALRRHVSAKNAEALSRVHVAPQIFWSRPGKKGEMNPVISLRGDFTGAGGRFIEHDAPAEIFPGVWFTGPVPRRFPERNWSGSGVVRAPDGNREDTVPEDSSLVFNTKDGLVLLSGCGHAGVANTIAYARETVRAAPVTALLGGFHLFPLDDQRLAWTIGQLRQAGVRSLLGAHCTGLEAVYRIRKELKLPRTAAVVAAVGSSFELGRGIDPGRTGLAK